MRAVDQIKQLIEDALSRLKLSASQIVDQLPPSALPPGGPSGDGYPPTPQDHTFITDFDAAVTDVVGTLGGFTDPTTDDGDMIYRDATSATRLPIGDDGQVLTVVSGEPAWADGADGTLPTHATFWHDEAAVTSGNALTMAEDAAYPYGRAAYQSPPANGDSFAQTCVLAAGSYTLFVLALAANNRGILDWSIDGTPVLTGQDWYAAGSGGVVIKSGSITVATSGLHTLSATVNGKNASSGDYYMALTKYWIA